jgi:hypothetical protein
METKTDQREEAIHDLIKEYLAAREGVRQWEEGLEDGKNHCREIEERLAKAMVFRGVRSQRLLDGSTIYLAPEVHLSKRVGITTEELIAALREAGLEDLVSETYQVRSLQSWAKENWERSRGSVDVAGGATGEDWDASLPAPLRGLLNLYQRTRVRVRNAPEPDPTPEELEADARATMRDGPLV